jgi:hypothetical protein
MKKITFAFTLGVLLLFSFAPEPPAFTPEAPTNSTAEKYGLILGTPDISSITELSFGPEGILFLGDPNGAAIHALDTKDVKMGESPKEYSISGFDKKIAAALGTTPENVKIHDMVVNPLSKNIYFSVSNVEGQPVLLKLMGEELETVPLSNVYSSSISLQDPVAADAKDRRDRPMRVWAVSDLQYHNGNVLISGLSNREFGSTFRSIPFPFKDQQDYASLEIYHAAHGQYETSAPIKTFTVVDIGGSDYLMASYTCTPLVLFPMKDLQAGKHVKGRTVAEMGYGNSPIDIISYEKDGTLYFAMNNSNRPVMRMSHNDIAKTSASLTEPLPEAQVTAGMPYSSLPMVNVLQMDMFDDENALCLQRTAEGDLLLHTRTTKWM